MEIKIEVEKLREKTVFVASPMKVDLKLKPLQASILGLNIFLLIN